MEENRKKGSKATIWFVLCVVCVCIAGFFLVRNYLEDQKATERAEEVKNELVQLIQKPEPEKKPEAEIIQPIIVPEDIPIFERYPGMDMPEVVVDERGYIGILEIPGLELVLPVAGELTEEFLSEAPCRYKGSLYKHDMIIAAHNYAGHFGNLNKLHHGAEVTFTDVNGNIFVFQVLELETMHRSQVGTMLAGDWDMTLFTCVPNTYNRLAVRLELVETKEKK